MIFPGKITNKEEYCRKVVPIILNSKKFDSVSESVPVVIEDVVRIYSHFHDAFKESSQKKDFLREISSKIKGISNDEAEDLENRLRSVNSNVSMWFNALCQLTKPVAHQDSIASDIISKIYTKKNLGQLDLCIDLISSVATYCIQELARENSVDGKWVQTLDRASKRSRH